MTDIIQSTLGMLFVSIYQLNQLLDKLRKTYRSGKTRPVEFRKQQLNQLLKGIRDMTPQLVDAIEKDLGRSTFATELAEITTCIWDIEYSLENVEKVPALSFLTLYYYKLNNYHQSSYLFSSCKTTLEILL